MGFWHTGYMEFHEHVGLEDFQFDTAPPQYPCPLCAEVFSSDDELRQHRFESHPLHRPTLFLQGRELGTHPFRITTLLEESDVYSASCDRAVLNGEQVPLGSLPGKLAQMSSDLCRLTLSSGEVSSEFKLDFRIATEADLRGIEHQLEKMALVHRLDTRSIEDFISSTSQFGSAIGYCDGICAYLYGVLAKERAPDSSLPYEAYIGKYSKAVEELAAYNRPLAWTVSSLIEFHFNHFSHAARLGRQARVGKAAARFEAWIRHQIPKALTPLPRQEGKNKLEAMVTDWETEQIARWAVQPLQDLLSHAAEMKAFLTHDIAEYDRVKIHVLLAETYAASGKVEIALHHAKALRNLSMFENWAESMIRMHSEDQHGQD